MRVISSLLQFKLTSKRQKEAILVAAIALIYLILWLWLPKPSFWGLDNGIKYQGARAFAANGTIQIPYQGVDIDPYGYFRPIVFPFGIMHENNQLPVFPALFIVFAGVFYAIFGSVGPFLLPLLGGWGCLAACWFMWVRNRENNDGRLFLLVVGLGSPLLFYSLTLWEQAIAMALVVVAITIINRCRRGLEYSSNWDPFLAGILIILAAAMRTEALFWAPIILVFWTNIGRRMNAILIFLSGLGIGLILLALFNMLMTGTPTPLHLTTNIMSKGLFWDQSLFTRFQNFYILTIEGFENNYLSLLGIIPLFAIVLMRRWRMNKYMGYTFVAAIITVWLLYAFFAFKAPDRAGYTVSSGGIFWIVPFLVLGVLFFKGERRRFWRFIWTGSLLFIFTVAVFSPHVRGVHWGPRIIVQVFPFLLILGAVRAQRWWRSFKAARPVIVVLVAASILNQAHSFEVLLQTKKDNVRITQWAASHTDVPILTEMWWLGGDLGTFVDKHKIFFTPSSKSIHMVVDRLREKGYKKLNYFEIPVYREIKYGKDYWRQYGLEFDEKYDYCPEVKGVNSGLRRIRLNIIPL